MRAFCVHPPYTAAVQQNIEPVLCLTAADVAEGREKKNRPVESGRFFNVDSCG